MNERRPPEPLRVDTLDLESLPEGVHSRLLLELIHDGAGRPIRLPVLVARAEKPGPVIGLTAAVHGNELNGIPVIHRLFDGLEPLCGTVVGVPVVNMPGYLAQQRGFMDGSDLNHQFPGLPDGNTAEVFVHRVLQRIVHRFDVLIDLHTASFGRVNSLYVRADMTQPAAARMAYRMRPQIILHNPPADTTLRGAAQDLGIPAITVEVGNPQRFHSEFVRRTLAGIRSVLGDHGVLRRRSVAPGDPAVLCERSTWMYTDRGGLLEVLATATERVHAGQVIARVTDLFGDEVAEYEAPEDGVVVGHAVNPVGPSGARIVHLGIPAPEPNAYVGPEE